MSLKESLSFKKPMSIKKNIKESTTPQKEIELTPIVKSLKGSFHATKNMDYKKELTRSLSKKYL